MAAANLTELARSLNKFGDSDLLIVGHTDSQGDDAYNQALSDRRARSAAAYLQGQGVPMTRISHEWTGRIRTCGEQLLRKKGMPEKSQSRNRHLCERSVPQQGKGKLFRKLDNEAIIQNSNTLPFFGRVFVAFARAFALAPCLTRVILTG